MRNTGSAVWSTSSGSDQVLKLRACAVNGWAGKSLVIKWSRCWEIFSSRFWVKLLCCPSLNMLLQKNKQTKKMQSFFLNTLQDKKKATTITKKKTCRLRKRKHEEYPVLESKELLSLSLLSPSPPTTPNSLNNTKKHSVTPNNQRSTLLAFSLQIFIFF